MKLSKQAAIVTGGAGGLGKGICLALAEEGANIAIVVNSNLAGGKKLADEINEKFNVKTLVLKADVSNRSEVQNMVKAVVDEWKKIDILVNNAGIASVKRIGEITEEEWDHVMDINVKGHYLCSHFVMPHMKLQRSGKIINMGSLNAKNGGIVTGGVYATSKGAIHSFTFALAKELAPYGINVNAVAPGPIETEMILNYGTEKIDHLKKTIPLGRIGRAEDVGKTIAFLASDDSAFITGEVIDINGGANTD